MYFPYLRGKQFEFLAVRELAQKGLLYKNNSVNVIPIFEPVKNNFNYFDEFITNNIIFGIVVNPKVVKVDYDLIQHYILTNESYKNNFFVIKAFIKILIKFIFIKNIIIFLLIIFWYLMMEYII